MSVASQTQALLTLVEADRVRRCDAVLGEARSRVTALLDEAHAEARRRMREAFREERARRSERVAAARANLQTRQRLGEQQRARAFLAAGWQRLHEELLRRWREPAARRAWVANVTADARRLLPHAEWRIAHAPDWPAAERDALAAELAPALAIAPSFHADAGIDAGLRIAALGNVIDGTIQGILADRAEIGARLLHQVDLTAKGAP
jgi:hypothetical protein